MAQQFLIDTQKWQDFVDATPEGLRSLVASTVRSHSAECVGRFYETLLMHPDAILFLSNKLVDTRLRSALAAWLDKLFSIDHWNATCLVEVQEKIGQAHARVQVPIHLVLRGSRILKREIGHYLEQEAPTETEALLCAVYASTMIDIGIEFTTRVFVQNARKEAEEKEAYRLLSVGEDIGSQREMQRTILLEWGQKFFFDLCCGNVDKSSSLENSDFGLWFDHKGSALFHGLPTVETVRQNIHKIDREILPALLDVTPPPEPLLQSLQAALREIGFLMDQMFKGVETLESGRDPLTKTLSRRFLPTILNREIAIAQRRQTPFSILMIDIDHFRAINQTYGHVGGDAALQAVAEVLLSACRASDFVIRYGGEEFLVVLADTPPSRALAAAERLRQAVEGETGILVNDQTVRATISVGVATFDGYPDYKPLIEAADKALYAAKAAGRNRCCVSQP